MEMEELKRIAIAHKKSTCEGAGVVSTEDLRFLEVFQPLMPELLALWEACNTDDFHCCLGDIAEEALDALNAKAASMDA